MALNESHPLYANAIRSLRTQAASTVLVDQIGSTDTAAQTTHSVFTEAHGSGVAPVQGIATDGSHWYELNTATIKKREFTTGAEVASNLTPFASLPAGVDHIGDGFVDSGLLYVPVVDWDGATQTSTKQTIAVYNTSDLSLNTQFDISAQSAFNGAGLCKSHNGTIYGVSFYSLSTPVDAQTDVYEFNLSTGAYISTKTLSAPTIGSQAILWTGDVYLVSSYNTIDLSANIRMYDQSLTFLAELNPTGIESPDEPEGLELHDGLIYFHKTSGGIRSLSIDSLYIHPNLGDAVKFLDAVDIPEEGTIVMRITPHTFVNYRTVFDNKDTANDWEAWIYGTGELAWRVSSAGRTGYIYGAANVEKIFSFSWKKDGSNVDIKLGIDGVVQDSATTVWVAVPSQGLWLGGGNALNDLADYTYQDVIVYDKELTAGDLTTLAGDFDDIYGADIIPSSPGMISDAIKDACRDSVRDSIA